MKKLEELTHQLHQMTCEKNERREFLASYIDKDMDNSVCVYMGVGNPPVRTQSSNEQEEESLDEGLKNVLKQKELVTQHGDLAKKLQHHVSVPEMRESVGKCPKTARACSAYLTDPLDQSVLSCDVPSEHLSIRGKSQQEPLKLVAGERGSTEGGIGGHAKPWLRMPSPDPGLASRAWPRATEAERPTRQPLLTPRLPSTKLSPHRLAPRAHPRPSPSTSAPGRLHFFKASLISMGHFCRSNITCLYSFSRISREFILCSQTSTMKRLLCSLLGLLCAQVCCECGCPPGDREDSAQHMEGVKQSPVSLVLKEGESTELQCNFSTSANQMQWFYQSPGGHLISLFYNPSGTKQSGRLKSTTVIQELCSSLSISSSQTTDSGTYFCAVDSQCSPHTGSQYTTFSWVGVVLVIPVITHQNSTKGSSLTGLLGPNLKEAEQSTDAKIRP
ncbi:hypothetical protein U0070_006646 [Myodes glareolus]|uniref:Ig-like domain-containing protein n=1 Tax=Myodes glareolus TaxID=447135 RepID=A0AAW0HFM1_MYOGA